jgi:hypothetical protein
MADGKVLITVWVEPELRKQANIAAQMVGSKVSVTIVKALNELIKEAQKVST